MDNTNRRRLPDQHIVTLQVQDSEGPSLFPVSSYLEYTCLRNFSWVEE